MRTLRSAWIVLTLIAGCAAGRLHHDGLAAIDRGEYETGVAELGQAVKNDPGNLTYRIDFETRRESAIETLMAEGDAARRAGQLEGASVLYRRILAIDPLCERALHGLEGIDGDKRHAAVLATARKDFEGKDYDAAEEKLRTILDEDPAYVPAQALAGAVKAARGPVTVAPRLQARDHHKVTLQLRDAPTKMVLEVLQRQTGINFILDKDVKSDSKTSIFVQDVPVEQAIELVLEQNQLARQILADNMVLIYPNTPAKQKDYEEQIVRTFYLTNSAPKDVESLLKTVLAAKTLYVDERSNVVVMRDTPDTVRMAEKLVASVDVAEPEVMLELEVLEISRSRIQELGIQYPTAATLTPQSAGTGSSAASAGLTLWDLRHQSSRTTGVSALSVTVNAMKQAGMVNTLASPRIRARNKEKAKVLIGSREPVITNSVTPTAAGTPVVTGSVQYLDVGLTLEVQPTIYLDSDVGIKLNLEVSSILKQVTTASGTVAYEIGTRNANTLLRLKDGETQILAGLIQDSDTRNSNSIPGLGDIPILSRLFGTHHRDQEKDEIVLSITPRIIRMQPRPAGEATEFWYGSESRMLTRPYAPDPESRAARGAMASQPAVALQPDPGPAARSSPMLLPEPGPPISAPPARIVAPQAMSAEKSERVTGGDSSGPSALIVAGPAQAKVGEEFDVQVQLATQDPITHLRAQLRFDSSALQLLAANPGDVVPAAAGGPTVSTRGAGAQLDVTTTAEDPVQGTGTLIRARFKAVAPRQGTNIAAMVNVLGGSGAAVGSSSAQPLEISIQP